MDPFTAILGALSLGAGVTRLIGDLVSRAQTDPTGTEQYVFQNYDQITALLGPPSRTATALAEERQRIIDDFKKRLAPPLPPTPPIFVPPVAVAPVVPGTTVVMTPTVVTPAGQPVVADPLPVVMSGPPSPT